uniref:Uncharacterized protein n=1 Tax=Rhizophora mucronata TaxID=61149 RepID=A0A2P2R2E3_RHIMU
MNMSSTFHDGISSCIHTGELNYIECKEFIIACPLWVINGQPNRWPFSLWERQEI